MNAQTTTQEGKILASSARMTQAYGLTTILQWWPPTD